MARQMKDSGVEWIGEIPETWDIAKVGYFFDIQLGKMLQPTQQSPDDVLEKYLCAANVGSNQLKYAPLKEMWFSPAELESLKVQKGDMLVVEGGDVASCDIVNDDVGELYFQNALHRVRPIADFDVRILKYWLWMTKGIGHIDLICNKATIAHFSKEKFIALPVVALSLSEQHRIAAFLDRCCAEIDAVMERTKATIEEYRKLKQAVITEAVTKGVRGARKMKDSGIEWIGEIPEGWEVCCLKRFCTFKTGSTPSTANNEWFDGDIAWYTPGDFSDDYVLKESKRTLSQQAVDDGIATIIPADTVLVVGIGATAGKISITTHECSCNQQITALIAPEIISRYLMYWMIANTTFLRETALFTTLPILNNETIGEYLFIIPDSKMEQQEIAAYLDEKCSALDTLIARKNTLLIELETYKKSLIYEYVTGKKEVP